MNNDKSKPQNGKQSPKSAKPAAAPQQPPPEATPQPVRGPPLLRKIGRMALVSAFIGVWAVYLWTLAPELTLEDSGELVTGAFYAGIPHPPGYPFWAIYSYLWTVI